MYGANIKTMTARPLSNRQRRRHAEAAIETGTKAFLVTLALLLAQKGGEMVVTQGTLDQVTSKLSELDYEVVPNGDTKGEFIVRLIDSNPVLENVVTGDDFMTPDTDDNTHKEMIADDAR